MRASGAIQRFSLGFRGPLCLVCGFTGVAPSKFALGAAVGALGTMPLQILVVSLSMHSAAMMRGHQVAIHASFVQSCLIAVYCTTEQHM